VKLSELCFGQVRRLLASPELVARTITAVGRENSTAEDTDVEKGDVIDAVGALEPVWDELYPPAPARTMRPQNRGRRGDDRLPAGLPDPRDRLWQSQRP
jgi:hypothetical protein